MPEMLGYFGKAFTVDAQVERACDTIDSGVRRLPSTVLLDDLRCDGSGHAGCEAQCRLYWKEAWLRPAQSGENRRRARGRRRLHEAREPCNREHPRDNLDAGGAEVSVSGDGAASEPASRWAGGTYVRSCTSSQAATSASGGSSATMTRIVLEEIGRRLGLVSNYPFRPNEMTGRSSTLPAPRGLRRGSLSRSARDTRSARRWTRRARTGVSGSTARWRCIAGRQLA